MAYTDHRRDPEYLKRFRRELKQDNIGYLRSKGVSCTCVACGVAIEEQMLGFLSPHAERVSFKELLRRADFNATLHACQRSPLACYRCRIDWRAHVRGRFPTELRDSLDGSYPDEGDSE